MWILRLRVRAHVCQCADFSTCTFNINIYIQSFTFVNDNLYIHIDLLFDTECGFTVATPSKATHKRNSRGNCWFFAWRGHSPNRRIPWKPISDIHVILVFGRHSCVYMIECIYMFVRLTRYIIYACMLNLDSSYNICIDVCNCTIRIIA